MKRGGDLGCVGLECDAFSWLSLNGEDEISIDWVGLGLEALQWLSLRAEEGSDVEWDCADVTMEVCGALDPIFSLDVGLST